MNKKEVKLEIPKYDRNSGIKLIWKDPSIFELSVKDNTIHLQANSEGLKSLAIHLLTLAQDNVPKGTHVHYDEHTSLEEGSKDFIIEKIKEGNE